MKRFPFAILVVGVTLAPLAVQAEGLTLAVPGLEQPVEVFTDELGVPHVYAKSEHDLFLAQGYLHARDRFFQMDTDRRAAGGTLAELTGNYAHLGQDAAARKLGLYAAAQRSYDLLEAPELAMAEAYVYGVNAWLAANPLPPEYAALEVSSVPAWSALDSLAIVKALGVEPTLIRFWEIDETDAVQSYVDALGEAGAAALYPADLGRMAPWVPRATVPDALGTSLARARIPGLLEADSLARPAALARRLRARAERAPLLAKAFEPRQSSIGSNAWGVAAGHSATGRPLVAGDGHPPLKALSSRYENHLVVECDAGALNVSGVTTPGIPGANAGQSTSLAFVWTSSYVDISDFFRDRLVRGDPACPARLCIDSAGALHPVEERHESYRVNQIGDGIPDNTSDVTAFVGAFIDPRAVDVLSVPFRSFGPVLEVEDPSVLAGGPATETSVLTVQYAGLHGTREARGIRGMLHAQDVHQFGAAVKDWGAVTAHFIVADVDGNLAFFSTGEIPLRADLEAGAVAGAPPWLIRDGSGPSNWVPDPARSQGQALPYAVIPPEEMPRLVNPPAGFVVNCNEDSSGFALDNELLNQSRPSKPSAIHYLGISAGERALRNGRVTAMLREKIQAGEQLSPDDMMRIQADTRPLHAELLVPFLLAALQGAQDPGAPPELAAFAADARIVEAAARLAAWDFSHPTGIPEGYDGSDVDGVRDPVVSANEAAHSVAATLYEVWFAKLLPRLRNTIASLGLTPLRPAFTYLQLLSQDPFTGVGTSGVNFFPGPAALSAPERRDLLLLTSFDEALDALAGPAYAAAFAGSTDQDDYRWGRLNRIVFEHPLGGASNIPPAAGFTNLAPGLPGLARDGTWDAVNVSSAINAPDGSHSFMNDSGSGYRFVLSPGLQGVASLTGGASGDPTSPPYASQLALSLTVDRHDVPMTRAQVLARAVTTESLAPAPSPRCGLGFELALVFPALAWLRWRAAVRS